MNKCLVCDQIIEDNFSSIFGDEISLCYSCFDKLEIRNSSFEVLGVKGIILYKYNEFFKDVLFRYKACYDYILKDAFLSYKKEFLKRKYKGYSIVLAPSNKEDEIKRGFNHLEEIFKVLQLPIIKCVKKNKKWKQSDKKKEEREKIQDIIKIDKTLLKGVKKVLVVDDILTTGSTIKAIVSQLPTNIDKKILVLASNCKILANEIV